MQIGDIYNLQVFRYAANSYHFHKMLNLSLTGKFAENESVTEICSMWSLNVCFNIFYFFFLFVNIALLVLALIRCLVIVFPKVFK